MNCPKCKTEMQEWWDITLEEGCVNTDKPEFIVLHKCPNCKVYYEVTYVVSSVIPFIKSVSPKVMNCLMYF